MAYHIVEEKCSGCGNCWEVCMNGAIIDLLDCFQIDPAWCIECGACTGMCYENAILHSSIDHTKIKDYFHSENPEYCSSLEILS